MLSAQISDLYAASLTDAIAAGPGRQRILHVSDVHLNPVGVEVIRQLAERFEVDAVLDTGDVTVTLLRASTRRFANTLRFSLSLRMANRGRNYAHSSQITMRVEAGGEQRAPFEFPNESLDPMTTATGSAAFDLPATATRAVLRTALGDQKAEKTFDLK